MSPNRDVTVPSRIGIFGGTFDPPHYGHLAAAEATRGFLDLDRMVLVVANDPWQKTGGGGLVDVSASGSSLEVSPVGIRLAMVRAAVADRPDLEVDDLEVRRGGPSYTADTVAEYAANHSDAELFVLVGSDVAPGLEGWVRSEEVRERATIVVMERPGYEGGRPPVGWHYRVVGGSFPDIAGQDLRTAATAGGDLAGLVPPGVADLIHEHGLYGIRR